MSANLGRGITLDFDYRGIGEIARSPWLQQLVSEGAHAIAGVLAGSYDEVFVDTYTTDRAAAAVIVLDRRAPGEELLSGRVTEAALRLGFEVGGR